MVGFGGGIPGGGTRAPPIGNESMKTLGTVLKNNGFITRALEFSFSAKDSRREPISQITPEFS